MAMNPSKVTQEVMADLESHGWPVRNKNCVTERLIDSIVARVILEIQQNAEVSIKSGSSAGTYQQAIK